MRLQHAWILAGVILFLALGVNAAPPDSDGDGVANNVDNCPVHPNPNQRDADFDGVGNVCDNCTLLGNAGQEDEDGDGFGNICDADLDNNGMVGISDYNILAVCMNYPGEAAKPDCRHADFNSDNRITSLDWQIMEELWMLPPGPSGLVP
jgi:hypothetical protein